MVSFKEYIARESQACQTVRAPEARKLLPIGSLGIDAASAVMSAGHRSGVGGPHERLLARAGRLPGPRRGRRRPVCGATSGRTIDA